MALVEYSGSEDSDQEEERPIAGVADNKLVADKPAFHKIVNRSDPHKIKIPLPALPEIAQANVDNNDERLVKRAKDSSSGFNSFLPAPKRATAGKETSRLGLARGVNLKTGATPGFTREPMSTNDAVDDEVIDFTRREIENKTIDYGTDIKTQETPVAISPEKQPQRKATIFKPLSVSRRPPKRKIPPVNDAAPILGESNILPEKAPKLSLFSNGVETELQQSGPLKADTYQPMIYRTASVDLPPFTAPSDPDVDASRFPVKSQPSAPSDPDTHNQANQSLDSIALDLNLSASARRQLLGRHGGKGPSATNIVNFNTDEEYAANEKLRQAGETVQHNPVRAIQPGKHSLKSLVSAVTMQKDALEEQFATGRRNKKEAGGKYGW